MCLVTPRSANLIAAVSQLTVDKKGRPMIGSKLRNFVLAALCGLASVGAMGGTAAVAAASTHHARHHHARPHHSSIPQHNGGDRDGDNNGAPSDGDGNQ